MPLKVTRADLCHFLSACYYEPTADFVEARLFASIRNQLGGGGPERDRIEALRRQFFNEHLGRWIKPFAAAAKNGAETAFYRALAGMIDSMLRFELAHHACQ